MFFSLQQFSPPKCQKPFDDIFIEQDVDNKWHISREWISVNSLIFSTEFVKCHANAKFIFTFIQNFFFSSWIPPGWMKVGLLVDVSSFSFVSICSASQTIYFGWNWKIVEALSSIKTAGMRWPLFRGSIPSLGGDSYIPIRWSGRSMPSRSIIINNQIKPIKEMTWQFQFRAGSRPALHNNFQRWIKRNWKHSLGNIKESMKLFNLYGNDIWPKAEKRVMGQLHICLNFQLESGFDCIIPR